MHDYTSSGPRVNHKQLYRDAAALSTQRATDAERDAALRTLAAQATTRYAGEQLRISKGLVIALNGGVTLQADGLALVTSQTDGEVVYTVNGSCECQDAAHGATEGRCKHRWAKTLTVRALALEAAPAEPETIHTLTEQLYGPQAAATAAQRTATHGGRPMTTPTPQDDDAAAMAAALDYYNTLAQDEAPAPTAPDPKPEAKAAKPQARPAACPEAALSLCLKGQIDGHDAQLTVRGQTPEEFHRNLAAVRDLLAVPTAPAARPAQPAEGWCAKHGLQMTQTSKEGRSWYSHKTAEGWCKGK